MTDLFAGAQPGDFVYYRGYSGRVEARKRIERITNTQLVFFDGQRFRLSDGRLVGWKSGRTWSTCPRVVPITDERATREWKIANSAEHKQSLERMVKASPITPSEEEFQGIQDALDRWKHQVGTL